MTITRDPAIEQPERYCRAVRAACCDACDYPSCPCKTTADIVRKALASWEAPPEPVSDGDTQ